MKMSLILMILVLLIPIGCTSNGSDVNWGANPPAAPPTTPPFTNIALFDFSSGPISVSIGQRFAIGTRQFNNTSLTGFFSGYDGSLVSEIAVYPSDIREENNSMVIWGLFEAKQAGQTSINFNGTYLIPFSSSDIIGKTIVVTIIS